MVQHSLNGFNRVKLTQFSQFTRKFTKNIELKRAQRFYTNAGCDIYNVLFKKTKTSWLNVSSHIKT